MEDKQTELNKIYLGDCLSLLPNIPDKSVDCIICDPPYGTTFCDWDSVISFEELWKQYKRIRKLNCPILLFGNEPYSSYCRLSNIEEYRYDIKWQKEKPTNVFTIKKQPGRVYEDIMVFYKHTPTYNPIMKERQNVTNPCPMKGDLNVDETNLITGVYKHSEDYNPNLVYPINIVKFNRDGKKGHKALHPTQKPLALIEYLIKTYSNEGDIILDNCSGSGTTAVACINTKRNYICMEKKEEYYKISVNRINKRLGGLL